MNQTYFIVILLCLSLSKEIFAHGKDGGSMTLPKYESTKLKGKALLRVIQVNDSYITTLTGTQNNFVDREQNDKKNPKHKEDIDLILKKLQNPAQIFSTKTFSCAMSMHPDTKLTHQIRTLKPSMSEKKIKNKDRSKYSESYYNVVAQYKLKCKKPIVYKDMVVRLFNIAPNLEELTIRFDTKEEGKKDIKLKRTELLVDKSKKAKSKASLPVLKQKKIEKNSTSKETLPVSKQKKTEKNPKRKEEQKK